MAEGTVQLPPDSTGKVLRTATNVGVASGAHQQVVTVADGDGTIAALAKDGADISSPTAMPAGGSGIRGWLSAIWTKLNGTLAVTGTFWQATQPVSLAAAVAVTDNSGSLTVDDGGTTLSIDDGGGSLTVDGTVALDAASLAALESITVVDGGGSLTVDGTVAVSGSVTVDSELTTQDYDTGAGTATTAVSGLVVPASGGAVAVTGDATNGLDVDVTRLPALPTGANVIGALSANQSVNNAQVNGAAVVTSVSGVQDVMPRKRTGSTGLSPLYLEQRINSKTTVTLVAATCYLQALVISVSAAGTAWTFVVQNGEATPKILIPSFTLSVPTTGSPIVFQLPEPVLMTTGVAIVSGGTTAGTADVRAVYWQ